MSENLMDGLFSEMKRVREIREEYMHPSLKGAGGIAAWFMQEDIEAAEQSIKDNDVVKMLQAYSKLKGYER